MTGYMKTHFLQGTLMFITTHFMRYLLLLVILGGVELHADFPQLLKIKANSGSSIASEELRSGKRYRITLKGEFSIWPEQLGNGIDAGYVYDAPISRIANNQWPAEEYVDTLSGDTYPGYKLPMWVGDTMSFPYDSFPLFVFPDYKFNLKKWTGFRLNGEPIAKTAYDPINHQYQFERAGDGTSLTFAIIDSVYTNADSLLKGDYDNNSGEIEVLIEEIIPYFVNICSAAPQLDPNDTTKMTGIKVDVSVLVTDTNKATGKRNILFDKNQVAIYDNGKFVCPDSISCNKSVESVSIAMLFDRTSSMLDVVSRDDKTPRIDAATKSATNFLNRLSSRDSVLMLSFSDTSDINVDVNWTPNKQTVQNSINTFSARLNTTVLQTALHKALITAIARTKSHDNRLKAIVALTDGANNIAPIDAQVVINELPATRNIPVFILALGMDTTIDNTITDPTEKFIDSIRAQNNLAGLSRMDSIAVASGGRVFLITNSKALDSTYALISRDIREQECCSIEYPVAPCEQGSGDTVRTIVIYYPFEGGVTARATTYKTNCAKTFLSKRQNGEELYTKVIPAKKKSAQLNATFPLQLSGSTQVRVELFDASGKLINSMNIKNLKKGSNSVTLSTNGLATGKYIAKVFAKGNMIKQHEIIIQE